MKYLSPDQGQLSISSDSSHKCPLKFIFLACFSKFIQFKLKFFWVLFVDTIAIFDLIWQFILKFICLKNIFV